jgi:hypothetical protein
MSGNLCDIIFDWWLIAPTNQPPIREFISENFHKLRKVIIYQKIYWPASHKYNRFAKGIGPLHEAGNRETIHLIHMNYFKWFFFQLLYSIIDMNKSTDICHWWTYRVQYSTCALSLKLVIYGAGFKIHNHNDPGNLLSIRRPLQRELSEYVTCTHRTINCTTPPCTRYMWNLFKSGIQNLWGLFGNLSFMVLALSDYISILKSHLTIILQYHSLCGFILR